MAPVLMILYLDMKAFKAARLDSKLRQVAMNVLRKLCGRIGRLPDSYLLSEIFNVSGMPRAGGGFANVRMGVFNGKNVAVKTLRVSEVDDEAKIRKVGKKVTLSHPGSLIHRTALLQRGGHVEEPVPFKHPRSHRSP